MIILLTGAVGFIGYHLSRRLLHAGHTVIGFDNLNDYYEVSLKESRLKGLSSFLGFSFIRGDLADADAVNALFAQHKPDIVINWLPRRGSAIPSPTPNNGVFQHPGGLPPSPCEAPSLRLIFLGIRYPAKDPLLHGRRRIPSHLPLRRHQKIQRTHGLHLQPPLRHSHNRPALLYRLRPLWPSGHALLFLYEQTNKGRNHPNLQ